MQQTYYIFRHGKAVEDNEAYGEKVLTASLLSNSLDPIKRLAEFLKTIPESTNFSSTLLRCRQTAEIVSSITDKKFFFDKRLNEFHNESFDSFTNRVKEFLEEECYPKNGKTLICTHAAVIAAMKHLICFGKFEIQNQLDYIQPGELLIIQNKKVKKINFNI